LLQGLGHVPELGFLVLALLVFERFDRISAFNVGPLPQIDRLIETPAWVGVQVACFDQGSWLGHGKVRRDRHVADFSESIAGMLIDTKSHAPLVSIAVKNLTGDGRGEFHFELVAPAIGPSGNIARLGVLEDNAFSTLLSYPVVQLAFRKWAPCCGDESNGGIGDRRFKKEYQRRES